MNNNENTKKNNKMVTVILLILLLAAIGYIVYDKCIKLEKPAGIEQTDNIESVISDALIGLKRVAITDKEEEISIGSNKYKIKREISVDGAFLLINDSLRETLNGSTIYAEYAYVTNKYAIFTVVGQYAEDIVYAIDKDGKEISLDENNYQMDNFEIVDGKLQATAHVSCETSCVDKVVVIKYENNTITIKDE